MKNPLKHQSAPVAARQSESRGSHHGHGHSSSIGHIFQGLAHRLRSDSPQQDQPAASTHSFHIVHLPDRPLVPIQPSDVPSEDECRLLLQGLQPGDGIPSPIAAHQEVSRRRREKNIMEDKKVQVSAQARTKTQAGTQAQESNPRHSRRPSLTASRTSPADLAQKTPSSCVLSSSSSSRPQTCRPAVPSVPSASSRPSVRKVAPISQAREERAASSRVPGSVAPRPPQRRQRIQTSSVATATPQKQVTSYSSAPSSSSRPKIPTTTKATSSVTNATRQRKARLGQTAPTPRPRQSSLTSRSTPISATNAANRRITFEDKTTWSASRVEPRPSVRSNSSSNGSTNSGNTSSSGICKGASNGGGRPMLPTEPAKKPSSIQTNTSRTYTERPLPPIHLSPRQQMQQRQSRPPAQPLSARPPLQLQPKIQSPVLASFAQRVSNNQSEHGSGLSSPIAVLPQPFGDLQATQPRRFHMDGQTYDEAMAPLQGEQHRPSSSASVRGRMGSWTHEERGNHTDENEVDVRRYVSVGYQPLPKRACLSPQCNGLCRHCTPMVLNYSTPEQRGNEENLQRQRQSKSNRVWRPGFSTPRVSSPLRQSHPSSPRPNSADVSPLTPPPQSPLRDDTVSPERLVSFTGPNAAKSSSSAADKADDPAIAAAIMAAEEQNGEPLLEWDVEAIKASLEGRMKTAGRPKRWDKDPRANRAAAESSSTALAFLIQIMSRTSLSEQKKLGIVSIGSVGQRYSQPVKAAASIVEVTSGPGYNIQPEQAIVCDDDGSGDYGTSWPEVNYYFGNIETIDEQPRGHQQTTTSSSSEKSSLKRRSHVRESAEVRYARHQVQR